MVNSNDIAAFDADGVGVENGNYFGFPFSVAECDLVLMSVPWDVTVSYGAGTHSAPERIIEASVQVDLFDSQYPNAWKRGVGTLEAVAFAQENNDHLRECASRIIEDAEVGGEILNDDERCNLLSTVNKGSRELNFSVYKQAKEQLKAGKIVGLVGGDHSTPLGLLQALGESCEFGILHIDAHADLRNAYEGFEFSHASIMRNAVGIDSVKKLVQVGIRDFSEGEAKFAQENNKIVQFLDADLCENRFNGTTWQEQCQHIVQALPENVYVSFDIDGLQQQYCPGTGTPVPGGLTYAEAIFLLNTLHRCGKRIVGFDLNEVSGTDESDWDANVGARVLYKLCGLTLTC